MTTLPFLKMVKTKLKRIKWAEIIKVKYKNVINHNIMSNNSIHTICVAVAVMSVLISIFIYFDFKGTIHCYESCVSSYRACLKVGSSSPDSCADKESHCKTLCFNKKSIL